MEILPESLTTQIAGFQRKGNEYGALVIRPVAIDPTLPVTPLAGKFVTNKTTFTSEGSLALFASLFGQLVSYKTVKGGRLFHDIFPVPGMEVA